MPAHYFYYCVSVLISAVGQVATGGSDKRYDQLRQFKDSFKKKHQMVCIPDELFNFFFFLKNTCKKD